MPSSDDEDTPIDVDPAYLSIFSDHLSDFRSHLVGKDGADALPASYFPPNAYWSSAEKDAFFRGLAIHSWLRPDLIAEEVKTKTLPDVCVYIAMLEKAYEEAADQVMYAGEQNIAVPVRLRRKDLPAAIEVSEEWIALEEEMANAMVARQSYRQEVLRDREEEVHVRRLAIRAPWGGARAGDNERDREGEKARHEEFEAWLAEKEVEWAGEDLLLSLDKVDLATLDRMIREDEDGRGMVSAHNAPRAEAEESTRQEAMDVDEPEPHHSLPAPREGEEFIDPLLLEISRPAATSSPVHSTSVAAQAVSSTTHMSNNDEADYFRPLTPPFPPSSLPQSPVQVLSQLDGLSAAPSAMDGSSMDGEDVSQMSPTSRRRHQKRLYMRRKRAQSTGAAVNEDTERLKPGRKPKRALPKGSSVSAETAQTTSGPSAPSVTEDGAPNGTAFSAHRHPHISGKTRPYKRQAEFLSQGVDAQRLRREGLDLFHLQSINKLMQTYKQLLDAPPSMDSEIAAETLRLLRGLVVKFVSEVMSRAITWREQERIAKLQSKVWRLRENQVISRANVNHALALYGADSLSKRAQFAGLLRKLDIEDSEEDDQGEDDEDDDDVSDEGDHDHGHNGGLDDATRVVGDLAMQPLSLLRTIFPPFMNPPSSGLHAGEESRSLDESIYMPWPSSSLLSTASEPPRDEDLIPEDFDEDALAHELAEEQRLGYQDHARDIQVEKELWTRMGRVIPGAVDAGVSEEEPPVVDDEPEPARTRSHVSSRPPRKRRRLAKAEEAEGVPSRRGQSRGGTADERDVEAELLGEEGETDAIEAVAPREPRKRKKGKRARRGPISKAVVDDSD